MSIANGLGIEIPKNIPIDKYAEIVEDYRDEIISLINKVASLDEASSDSDLQRTVANINKEIYRIKDLKRTHILNAMLTFAKNNDSLIKASIFGAALGAVSPLLGCAGAGGIMLQKKLAKSNFTKDNPDAKRLGQEIIRDIKPYVDAFSKVFFRSDDVSVRIFTIQNIINGRVSE